VDPNIEKAIKQQILKSTEKLEAAKSLLRENFIDDAISRAYYSIYHAASAVLLSKGLTANTHRGLKIMFGLYFIETGEIEKEFGQVLSKLKDERENGDYDVFVQFEKEDAQDGIKDAERFLKEMRHYLEESPGIKF